MGFIWDVSKNNATPKWMVKIMENPIKKDDLEVPLLLETAIYFQLLPSFDPRVAPWFSYYSRSEMGLGIEPQRNEWTMGV